FVRLSLTLSYTYFFFFMHSASSESYTLSLHDALPISDTLTVTVDRGGPVQLSFFGGLDLGQVARADTAIGPGIKVASLIDLAGLDRKSTRLNSSHVAISYAVFCLKKKK